MTDRVLTEIERRESVTETMASWALDGMYPTEESLSEIRAYVAGEFDEDEMVERAKARHFVG